MCADGGHEDALTSPVRVDAQAADGGLARLRAQIDATDAELVRLLNRRARISLCVGDAKALADAHAAAAAGSSAAASGSAASAPAPSGPPAPHFYRPGRERQVYERVAALNASHGAAMPDAALAVIWREIISASIALQSGGLAIAYVGLLGSFEHEAALQRFGESARFVACASLDDAFALLPAKAAYVVAAFEDSIGGNNMATLDALLQLPPSLHIRAETCLVAEHHVATRAGGTSALGEIARLFCDSLAYARCRQFVAENLPRAKVIIVASMSEAASALVSEGSTGCGALLNRLSIDMNDCETLHESVDDPKAPFSSRFFVVGDQVDAPTGDDKTLLLVDAVNRPGSLAGVFDVLRDAGVNVANVVSRPFKNKAWHYSFFLEVSGHLQAPPLVDALACLQPLCESLRVLGSYPSIHERGMYRGECGVSGKQ